MSLFANWPWALCLIVRFALVFLIIFSLSQAIASGYDLAQIARRRYREHLHAKQQQSEIDKQSLSSPIQSTDIVTPDDALVSDATDPQSTEPAVVIADETSVNPTKKKSRAKQRRAKSDSSKCVTQIDKSIKTTSKPAVYKDTPAFSEHEPIKQSETVKQSPSKSTKSSKSSSLLAALAALEQVDDLIDEEIDSRADADSDDWCTVAKTSKVKPKSSNNRFTNQSTDSSSLSHKRSSRVTLSKVTRDSDGVKSASLFVLTTRTKQTVVPTADDQSTHPLSNPPPYSATTNDTAVVRSPSPFDSELACCSTSDVWSDVLSEVSANEETTDMISQSTEGEQVEGFSELTGRMEGQPTALLHQSFTPSLGRSFSPLVDRLVTQPISKYNQSLNVRSFNYSQYHAIPLSITETKMQETQSLQSQSVDRPTPIFPTTRSNASPRKGPPGFPARPPAVHPLLASLKYGSQSLFSRAQPTPTETIYQASSPTSRQHATQHLAAASPRAAPIVEPSRLAMSADDYSDYEQLIDQVLASPSDEDEDDYMSGLSGISPPSALSMHSWSMSSQRLDATFPPFSFADSSFLNRPAQTAIIDDSSSITGWPQRRAEPAQVHLPLAKTPQSPKRSWRAPERGPITRW